MRKVQRSGGFTLVEIMIVVLIIGILLAIAVPNFMHARDSARTKSCITNLREIQQAKEQYAMAHNLPGTAVPSEGSLAPDYIRLWPNCPSSGVYVTNSIDDNPTCSFGGTHTLSKASGLAQGLPPLGQSSND